MKITSKHLKILLAVAVLLNLVLGYKVVKAKYFRYETDVTYDRKNLFKHLKIDSSSIVFIGNSLTRQYELAELFNNTKLRNRGINGDNLWGIYDRLQLVIDAKPQKIFVENGINDILLHVENEKILEQYKKVLDKLQLNCKTSRIYVQSILPVYKKGIAIEHFDIENTTIKEVNTGLRTLCESRGITFINIYDKFIVNGEMNPLYCIPDGLHLSGDGYILLTKLLEPYVNAG